MSEGAGQAELFAVTTPGLEPLVQRELRALGITDGVIETGGVTFRGGMDRIQRANLWLRAASRVIVRVTSFNARAMGELERRARLVPWERYVGEGRPVRFRVTARKSRLYHTGAIAERLEAGLRGRVPGAGEVVTTAGDDDESFDAQQFIVRVMHDQVAISADSSGELLHRRGYREAIGKAPIRETLAAAALLGSGWYGQAPLIDPLCGSGTIAIEGALIARRLPPGLNRTFAFMGWPDFDPTAWEAMMNEVRAQALPRSPVRIQASDRDAGAIASTMANAERAGVAADVEAWVRAISGLTPPTERGWLVSNPPYGHRVGDPGRLRDLYAQLGNVAREALPGWNVALISADPVLERHTGLHFAVAFETSNGGIPVRLVRSTVPES